MCHPFPITTKKHFSITIPPISIPPHLSPPLPCSILQQLITHHSYSRKYLITHTYTCALTHAHLHVHTLTHTPQRTLSQTPSHTHTSSHTPLITYTPSHVCTLTHTIDCFQVVGRERCIALLNDLWTFQDVHGPLLALPPSSTSAAFGERGLSTMLSPQPEKSENKEFATVTQHDNIYLKPTAHMYM